MFHMKWVNEGKKNRILILYRYVNDEVIKFEDIGEPNLPSKIVVISSQRKKYVPVLIFVTAFLFMSFVNCFVLLR